MSVGTDDSWSAVEQVEESVELSNLTRVGSQAQVSSPRRVDEVEVVVEVKVEQR